MDVLMKKKLPLQGYLKGISNARGRQRHSVCCFGGQGVGERQIDSFNER